LIETVQTRIGSNDLIIETGRLARQAAGSVTVRLGDTVVLAAVTASRSDRPDVDFLPLAVDYRPAFGTAGSDSVYEIVLIPRDETPSVWGKIVLTIRKSDLIPLSYVYFDERGDPMREMTFSDPTDFGGRTLPAVLEMKPLKKQGHRTVIRYLDAQFDTGLPKDTFTHRNLRRRR